VENAINSQWIKKWACESMIEEITTGKNDGKGDNTQRDDQKTKAVDIAKKCF
jgi:hypothetical protein